MELFNLYDSNYGHIIVLRHSDKLWFDLEKAKAIMGYTKSKYKPSLSLALNQSNKLTIALVTKMFKGKGTTRKMTFVDIEGLKEMSWYGNLAFGGGFCEWITDFVKPLIDSNEVMSFKL